MNLSVDHFKYIVDEYKKIQAINPKELVLFDSDYNAISISAQEREDWKFMGLGCVQFIEWVLEEKEQQDVS